MVTIVLHPMFVGRDNLDHAGRNTHLLTRRRVSQSASFTRSIPSTTMSVLTTTTAVTHPSIRGAVSRISTTHGYKRSVPINSVAPRCVHELVTRQKVIDTPIPPRFAKTPDTGKMIMPSCGAVRDGCVCAWNYLQERPSRALSSAPKMTAGMAAFANIARLMGSIVIR